MPKIAKVRLVCRALPYLEPVNAVDPAGDPAAAFVGTASRTPVRAAIEARSDLGFVADLTAALAAVDLDDTRAPAAALTVLGAPTLTARTTTRDGAAAIVQSVVLDLGPDEFQVQITAEFAARPGKPGHVTLENAHTRVVDLDDDNDACSLVADVERWWNRYPMPTVHVPEPFPLRPWAVLGDPTHVGVLDTPAGWRANLETMGSVYGVTPFIVDSAGKVAAWSLQDRIQHAVVVRGTKWANDFPPDDQDGATGTGDTGTRDIEVSTIGEQAVRFDDLAGELRALLLREARAATAPTPSSRDLEAGEIVYHRKVGDSRKFDRFDNGSTQPCIHGAGSFGPWGGDKATKGMARRYDNFSPDMLIHCSKYPKCGMYGVDASRGGLKAEPSAAQDTVTWRSS